MKFQSRNHRGKRYARRATRRVATPRDPRRRLRVLAVILGVVAVVTAALIWGSVLKAKSDAYRASLEEGVWTVTEAETLLTVAYPSGNATTIAPGEWIDPSYDGVILYMGSGSGESTFDSAVLTAAGLPSGKGSASDEIDRLHRKQYTVTGLFQVTSLSTEDAAEAAYRRGLEMAMLMEFAREGVDDLLLSGVPTGTDAQDAAAAGYLIEVKKCLADVGKTPSVGVVLPLHDFARMDEEGKWAYTDCLTPGRMLTGCDYLVADLTGAGEALEIQLEGMQYPYARYGLRLLLNMNDETAEEVASSHGFERILMYTPQ